MTTAWVRPYMKLTEFLGAVLGPDYEVVLHDLGNEDKSIIAIANGHVSGRTIGAPLTSMALQTIVNHSHDTPDFRLNYVGVAGDKLLRSSTLYVKDEAGALVGLLCINFDDSRYRDISDRLLKLRHPDVFVETNFVFNAEMSAPRPRPGSGDSESLHSSLPEVTDYLLTEALARRGGDRRLTHRDKLALVEALDARGVFLMKGAVRHVADRLGVSQTTVYRYLSQLGDRASPDTD
ncbi:PAS domain-containing protein [Paracoccus sp. (in: a-proteobacteria)]|uniref:helix-turn-helix transcriptional regulator n=1 Tax=Paracoccus sp. TaxID=267 RepID=UPI003220892C